MTRRTIELAAFCTALIVAALAVHAWLASRDEQQRLAATLAAQKQVIDAANADERVRQASLADALAQIEKLKRDVQTPAQILAALPKYLQLPQPITLSQPAPSSSAAVSTGQGTAARPTSSPAPAPVPQNSSSLPSAPSAQIPAADLKPLFDYVQDCRACQAQLAAAQKNSADDAAKISALTRERDAAVTAAKGGSFLRRLRRNAVWFAVGVAAGYVAKR